MYIDFFLFIIIFILTFVNANSSYFTGPVLKWLNKATAQEKNLLDQKRTLKLEQSHINMVDNFAKHAKIQRKINGLDEELSQLKSNRTANNFVTRLFIQYGMKIPVSLILLFMIVTYRYTPVLILNEKYDLFPFSWLISYPLKETNAVSVHLWVICCSSIMKSIKT